MEDPRRLLLLLVIKVKRMYWYFLFKGIPTEWKIEDPEMNSGWHFIFSKTSANSPYREDTID